MNKAQLIEAIAASTDLPKVTAGRALDAITGATIKIAAAKLPGFKAGKTLKDAVN